LWTIDFFFMLSLRKQPLALVTKERILYLLRMRKLEVEIVM
jgi:hypothetical protein